jgi:peptide-methionine (R)-S-oxide reductase
MRFAIPIAVAFAVTGLLFGAILSESAPAFEVSYAKQFAPGIYRCASCRAPLFRSEDKFASTTRWPSFRATVPGAVTLRRDRSYGLDRVEVVCGACGAHLGHVFPDGAHAGDTAPEACDRYCVLSSSLTFEPRRAEPERAR